MNKHWFKGFSCVSSIRSTDTYDVIIPVSSSDDASVLRPPSAEAWTDYTATDHPNQTKYLLRTLTPGTCKGRIPSCSSTENQNWIELMAVAMISQQININKNKRAMQERTNCLIYAISRLLFITMATCEREPWCVPLTDVTSLYSLDMQMCWSSAHCYSLPPRQMRLILFVYLLTAFRLRKKLRHRSLDASTGLKMNAVRRLWIFRGSPRSSCECKREVELWLLSSLISSPVEGSIGPWTWLRADWLPRWWVGAVSVRAAAVLEEPVSVSAACRRVKYKRWILFLKRAPHMSSILSHYTNSFIKPLTAN